MAPAKSPQRLSAGPLPYDPLCAGFCWVLKQAMVPPWANMIGVFLFSSADHTQYPIRPSLSYITP